MLARHTGHTNASESIVSGALGAQTGPEAATPYSASPATLVTRPSAMSRTKTAGSTRPTSCSPHSSLHRPLPLHPFFFFFFCFFFSDAPVGSSPRASPSLPSTAATVTPEGHSGVGSGAGASATYATRPSAALQLMPPNVPSTHTAPCVFGDTSISAASAPPSQISTHTSAAPRSPSSLPLLTTMRLFPDGDTLDARTPRSSVPNGGWYRGVDAPLLRSLSTFIAATDRLLLLATRSRCDVVTRRVSREGSRGSLCSDAPAAKGRDANDSNSEVSASTTASSSPGSPADIAVARC
mmetsp:Transcript_2620/g.10639  ORF Transcript_2620/g.10639 Transcript_2620/m.10639 type:complete len:295 (-) Transcript_2620:203-1087(-)